MFLVTRRILKFKEVFFLQRPFTSAAGSAITKPKVCIVGSGPGGFYAAQQILKMLPSVEVDILDRLPVPFGLVRYGVAPDHPEVKNVINTFTKTASDPRVNFIGNVRLGQDVFLDELCSSYHSVLLAYGAECDRLLSIPGENLKNVISAREFVGWYNGLPENKDLEVDLNVEKVAILGQGNVALDIARILLTPIDLLKKTDITEYSLAALSESKVKEVMLIGRRGPLQAAFTIKEFREMLRLPNCFTEMNVEDFCGLESIIPTLERPRRRLTELLLKTAKEAKTEGNLKFQPIFYHSPMCFERGRHAHAVGAVKVAVNKMEGSKAIATDVRENLDCGLALRSIGFKSVQAEESIPFDESRGIVVNNSGIVKPGLYVSGWLGTGPVGVIISTMSNAFAVGKTLATHLLNSTVDGAVQKPGNEALLSILKSRGIQTVNFNGWECINQEEIKRGKERGKPREKIVDVSEMLAIASGHKESFHVKR